MTAKLQQASHNSTSTPEYCYEREFTVTGGLGLLGNELVVDIKVDTRFKLTIAKVPEPEDLDTEEIGEVTMHTVHCEWLENAFHKQAGYRLSVFSVRLRLRYPPLAHHLLFCIKLYSPIAVPREPLRAYHVTKDPF
ncbi:hypothetical protein ACU8KH_03643 [Lachancea thermotolerans]